MTDVASSPHSGWHGLGRDAADPFFDTLFRTYAPRVRALGDRLLPGRGLGDDVVQETFLRAYRFQGAFDQSRPAWPWLRTIACNVCTDLVRTRSASEQPCASGRVDEDIDLRDPVEAVLASERSAVVAAALAAVSPRQRRVLLLRDGDGWENDDVAELESTTLDAVKSALKRGRHAFREAYLSKASERGLLGVLPFPVLGAWRRSRIARLFGSGVNASVGLLPTIAMPAVIGALAVGAALAQVPFDVSGHQPVATTRVAEATPAATVDASATNAARQVTDAFTAGGTTERAAAAVERRIDAPAAAHLPLATSAQSSISPSDRASVIVQTASAVDEAASSTSGAYADASCQGSEFRQQVCASAADLLSEP